jgi:ABC-type dipeptide/oligopeptide/nickel transport system permease subunit
MSAIIATETEGLVAPPRRRGLPGVALIRSTHGLQRGMLLTGLVVIAIFIVVAALAPIFAPFGFNADRANGVVFGTQQAPSAAHWLGTTVGGQDVFSRVIFGARTALTVIVLAVAISLLVGVPLGVVSLYAFPSLLLAIVVSIMITGGRSTPLGGILAAALSITVVFVPQYFRVVRNQTVSVKNEPFVDAARITGARPRRIMFKHVLPNVSQTIPVLATLNASEAILTLAGLGFLGFGIEPSSAAEWGYDLNKALADATNGIWWTGVYPGLAIVLVVAGVTLVGESLNDILNPMLRTRGSGTTTADEQEIALAGEGEGEGTTLDPDGERPAADPQEESR